MGDTVSPASYDVPASIAALPEPMRSGVLRFQNALADAKPSTRNDYKRHTEAFLAWCHLKGLDLQGLPPNAPEMYYLDRGWGREQTYRNIVTSALRAFMRWSNQEGPNGLGLPELEFPPSVRPPKRKPRVVYEAPTQEGPYYHMNETNGSGNGNSFGNPGNVDGGPAEPSVDAGAPAYTPAAYTPTPFASIPAFAPPPPYVPPQPVAGTNAIPHSTGGVERQLQRQRVVDKRQTANRNPLGSILPSGGKLDLYRMSDGTDGHAAGNRVLVGSYTEKDVRGYNDFSAYVRECVHPYQPPLQKAPVVVYYVEHWDDAGRMVGAPREIKLSNVGIGTPVGGFAPVQTTNGFGGFPPAPAPSAQTGSPQVDSLLNHFMSRMSRYEQWQEEQHRNYQELLEKAKHGDGGGNTQLMWMLQNRPAPLDVRNVVEDVFSKVKDIVKTEERSAPLPMFIPPPPAPKEDPIAGKLVEAFVAKQNTPVADPYMAMERMATLMRPAQDPLVHELREQNRRLEDQFKEAVREMKETTKNGANNPQSWFQQMMQFDEMMQRKLERQGGGGAGAMDVLATALDKLPAALKEIRLGNVAPPEAQPRVVQGTVRQGAAQGQEQPRPQPRQGPPPLTDGIADAFRQLAAAQDAQSDQGVLNGVFSLVVGLAQAPAPWPEMLTELNSGFQSTQTVDDLQFLIHRLFMACQQEPLLRVKPGLVRFVTDVLGFNFASVCEKLGMTGRDLPGVVKVTPPAPSATNGASTSNGATTNGATTTTRASNGVDTVHSVAVETMHAVAEEAEEEADEEGNEYADDVEEVGEDREGSVGGGKP